MQNDHSVIISMSEYEKFKEYENQTDISSILDIFKEYLSKLHESGSKKFIDMFLNEEFFNKK